MGRWLLAGGAAAMLVGAALIAPAVVGRLEKGSFDQLMIAVLALGLTLMACGLVGVARCLFRWAEPAMPPGVRIAVTANIIFLACFALEISDGLTRRGGAIHPIGWTMFTPTLLLLYGLLSGRRWAWWIARGVAAIAVVWFLGFAVLIPFVHLQREQGPVPWWGRLYMICVSLALAGILAGGFLSLGRSAARSYFASLDTKV